MGQQELTKRISDRLHRQVAFGGMTKRKTTEGEVILKCPVYNGQGDFEELASDITSIFVSYVEEEGFKHIKTIVKDILK